MAKVSSNPSSGTPPGASQPTPLSNLKLKISYWYISNKLRLRQGAIGFLILVSVGLYSYSIYRAGVILFVHDVSLRQDLNNLTSNEVNFTAFHQANAPKQIEILSFDSTGGADGRYDFVVKIDRKSV